MKFVCDKCGTRYGIPDQRVAGRVLRVRCKTCRTVIDVVGPMGDDEVSTPGATKPERLAALRGADVARHVPMFSPRHRAVEDPFVAAGGSGAWTLEAGCCVQLGPGTGPLHLDDPRRPPPVVAPHWHVAERGRSRGPFTLDELEVMAARGRIRRRSWVWRAGCAGWTRLQEVPELAVVCQRAVDRATAAPVAEEGPEGGPHGFSVPAGWDGLAPGGRGRPFVNLVSSDARWSVPPEVPQESTEWPVVTQDPAPGFTEWFLAAPGRDVEGGAGLSPGVPVQGASPLVTGVHVVRQPWRRAGRAALLLVALAAAALAVLALPTLVDLDVAERSWVRPVARGPAAPVAVPPGPADRSLQRLAARPGTPEAPKTGSPVSPPGEPSQHAGTMERLARSLTAEASKLLGPVR
jgi:predicted Zn finger-like uncharacterized protein